jgi:hypothetical protein
MTTSRRRITLVGIFAAVAVLSVGATAYAAEQGPRSQTSQTSAEQSPTPAQTSRATPSGTPTVSAVPAPVATVDGAAPAPAAQDAETLDEGTASEASASASPTDGNVVEVRTPNPEAVPDTPAEYEHFYGLITECMGAAGYDWHGVWLSDDSEFEGVNLTQVGDVEPDLQAGFTLALYGDTGGGDYYHWADAGCWGYAVHVTGNDGNN